MKAISKFCPPVRDRLLAAAGRMIRFGVSTIVSAALTVGLPIALHEGAGMAQNVAVAAGFVTAYLVNLVMLKAFVYRSSGSWLSETWRYVVVNGAFRLIEYGAFYLLSNSAGWDYRLAVLAVLALSAIVKFIVYGIVFRVR